MNEMNEITRFLNRNLCLLYKLIISKYFPLVKGAAMRLLLTVKVDTE